MLLLSDKKEVTAKEVNKALIALQKDIKNNPSSTTVVQNGGGSEPIDTYTKTEIDNKDAAVLAEAKDYTNDTAVISQAGPSRSLAAYVVDSTGDHLTTIDEGATGSTIVKRTPAGKIKCADITSTDTDGTLVANKNYADTKASSIRLSGADASVVVLGSEAGEIGRVQVNNVAHASSSDSASYVKDYNNSNRAIYIGYDGAGATASEVNYLCAYKDANHLKDMSKAEVKTWLGIGGDSFKYKGYYNAATNTPPIIDGIGKNFNASNVQYVGTSYIGQGVMSVSVGNDLYVAQGTYGQMVDVYTISGNNLTLKKANVRISNYTSSYTHYLVSYGKYIYYVPTWSYSFWRYNTETEVIDAFDTPGRDLWMPLGVYNGYLYFHYRNGSQRISKIDVNNLSGSWQNVGDISILDNSAPVRLNSSDGYLYSFIDYGTFSTTALKRKPVESPTDAWETVIEGYSSYYIDEKGAIYGIHYPSTSSNSFEIGVSTDGGSSWTIITDCTSSYNGRITLDLQIKCPKAIIGLTYEGSSQYNFTLNSIAEKEQNGERGDVYLVRNGDGVKFNNNDLLLCPEDNADFIRLRTGA